MNLTEYMNRSIEKLVGDALRNSIDNPKESLFLLKNRGVQKKASEKRRDRETAGEHIPPFLIASVATQCNLHCKGCYARACQACTDSADSNELSAERWSEIFREASSLGISFILLAGGEPFTRKSVLESASEVKEIIFPVFTNGTMLNEENLAFLDLHRNLVPVLSIEGNENQTDERRGPGTYRKLRKAMEEMGRRGIYYAVSVTVTKENLDSVSGNEYIEMLRDYQCKLVFFVEYVPVDPKTVSIALTGKDRDFLEKRQNELRSRFDSMIFLSFPGDEEKMGGCLAAGRGFFHINAKGGAEPCPFSPYSDSSLRGGSLRDALKSPLFRRMKSEGLTESEHAGGCALFGKEDEIQKLMEVRPS